MRLFLLFIGLFFSTAWPSSSQETTQSLEPAVNLTFFISSDCPYCQKAEQFVNQLRLENPWIQLNKQVINEDKKALMYFQAVLSASQSNDFTVPAFFFCGSHWSGFNDAQTSGQLLTQGLMACRMSLLKGQTSSAALAQLSHTYWYLTNVSAQLSPFGLITSLALLDAISPLTMWSIMSLVALLVIIPNKRWLFGSLFLLTLGLMHSFEQTHLFEFYHLALPWRILALLTGISLVGFCGLSWSKVLFQLNTWSCSIIYVLLLSIMTALTLQIYQNNSAPNFALLAYQWLSIQSLSAFDKLFYLTWYQVIYTVVIAVNVMIGIWLLSRQRVQRYRDFFHQSVHYWLFATGLLLISSPALLGYTTTVGALLLVSLISGKIMPISNAATIHRNDKGEV